MATPPFDINAALPATTDLLTSWPGQVHGIWDVIESWLTVLSDPTTGKLKPTGIPNPLSFPAGQTTIFQSADNAGELTLAGGSAVAAANGAYIKVAGNTHADLGKLILASGTAGSISLLGNTAITGTLAVSGNVTAPNLITPSYTGTITLTGTGALSTGSIVAGFGNIDNRPNSVSTGALTVSKTVSIGGPVTASSTMAVSGNFTAGGSVDSGSAGVRNLSNGLFIGSNTQAIMRTALAGTIYLQPRADGSVDTTLDSSGNLYVRGYIQSANNHVYALSAFASSNGSYVILAPGLATSGISGTVYLRPQGLNSTTGQATVDASGNFVAYGNVSAYSDRRVKSRVKNLNGLWASDMVRELNPKTFRKHGQKGLGFIAQDVRPWAPELVIETPDGMLALAETGLIAVLWREVQTLQRRLDRVEFGE